MQHPATTEQLVSLCALAGNQEADAFAELVERATHRYLLRFAENLERGDAADRALLGWFAENYPLLRASNGLQPQLLNLSYLVTPFTKAQLFLLMAVSGAQGRMILHFPDEVSLNVGYHAVTVRGEVELESDGERIVVAQGDRRIVHVSHGEHWLPQDASPSAIWRHADFETLVLTGHSHDLVHRGVPGHDLADVDVERATGKLARAVALLATWYPAALPWLARAARAVAVARPHPEGTFSGTTSDCAGLLFYGEDIPQDYLCLTLLHECAHTYCNLLHASSPLTKPGHAGQVYSPFKLTMRPAHMTMMALHAMTNMRLFTMDYGFGDAAGDEVRRDAVAMDGHIAQMRDDLLAGDALTEVGREFVVATSRERLREPALS